MRILRNNSLTIVLMLLFAGSIIGQWIAGWHVETQEAIRQGKPLMSLGAYTLSPQFLSSVFENWESEFLQMAAFVILTACLIQRGSPESRDPDAPPRDANLAAKARNRQAPAVLRMGALARALYARSLGIALGILFILSFLLHWINSAHAAAQDAAEHGEAAPSLLGYLTDAELWFESFQNWQSEFLSTAVLVVLSIYLRQAESPESKAVAAPHRQTGT